MAEPKLCSISDCGKEQSSRGLCCAHYNRYLKHGDPLAGRPSRGADRGEAKRFLAEVVLPFQGRGCLRWPFGVDSNGYARFARLNSSILVSRLVCMATHGNPPDLSWHAAHTCGKGHEACVSPGHLIWKTRADNNADKLLHGRTPRGSGAPNVKLSEAAAFEIFLDPRKETEIARDYGVHYMTVHCIKVGRSWRHVTGL